MAGSDHSADSCGAVTARWGCPRGTPVPLRLAQSSVASLLDAAARCPACDSRHNRTMTQLTVARVGAAEVERWSGCSTPTPSTTSTCAASCACSALRRRGGACRTAASSVAWCSPEPSQCRTCPTRATPRGSPRRCARTRLPTCSSALAPRSRAARSASNHAGPRARSTTLQPVMVVDRAGCASCRPAPLRRSTRRDVDALAAAAAVMHREEMSADTAPPDASAWRARMNQLVDRGWSWVWIEGGEVVFKAELSAWTPDVVQIREYSPVPRGAVAALARRG